MQEIYPWIMPWSEMYLLFIYFILLEAYACELNQLNVVYSREDTESTISG